MITENIKIGDHVRDKDGDVGEVIELHGDRWVRCEMSLRIGNNMANNKIVSKKLWYLKRTLELCKK